MTYDLVTLIISSYYLLGRSPIAYFSFSRIARMIIFDGLGFFFLLTAVNILNLILFKTSPTALQAAGSVPALVASQYSLAPRWLTAAQRRVHPPGRVLHLTCVIEIGDDTSRGRTPKEAPNFMGGEGGSSHEMGIRITIRREVQHDGDDPSGTPTAKSVTLGSADKNREAFGDV
ncbi:hypothetical protein AURDEDRAFT_168006 [Auricularia subglabra TFB-10046 SS5]|nr:hypothetical protein AURDEDRAFT_168006 [Auricularia subglabra TFB-10046 SS5]